MPVTRARVKVRVLTEASRIRIVNIMAGLWHTLYGTWIRCLSVVTRTRVKVRVLTEASRIRIMASIIPGYDARHQGKGEGESAHRGQKYPDNEQGPGCGERMQQERGHHLRGFLHIIYTKIGMRVDVITQ
jgi:hypothetical protein